jgi:hypothetical protein
VVSPPGGGSPQVGCDAAGDSVKPAGEGAGFADRGSTPQQQQERGLEGILGIRQTAQEPAANPQDHGTMPADDFLERRLGPGFEEGAKQFTIASSGHLLAGGEGQGLAEYRG